MTILMFSGETALYFDSVAPLDTVRLHILNRARRGSRCLWRPASVVAIAPPHTVTTRHSRRRSEHAQQRLTSPASDRCSNIPPTHIDHDASFGMGSHRTALARTLPQRAVASTRPPTSNPASIIGRAQSAVRVQPDTEDDLPPSPMRAVTNADGFALVSVSAAALG